LGSQIQETDLLLFISLVNEYTLEDKTFMLTVWKDFGTSIL